MFHCIIFVSVLRTVTGYNFKPDTACAAKDLHCIEEVVRDFFTAIGTGIEELGVETLDPLHHDIIENNVPDLQFCLKDSFVKGLKDTVLNGVTITEENKIIKMHFDITLPKYQMTGKYKIAGKLILIPVIGEGNYVFKTTNVHILVTATKAFYEKDGKKHLTLIDITTKSELLGPITFDVQNLFGGNKGLAEPVLKFINENPKIVAELWQDAINIANTQAVFDNFNKMLEFVSLEELVNHTL